MAIVRVPIWFRGSIAAATTVAVVLLLSACNPYPGGGIVSTVDAVDFGNPLLIPPSIPTATESSTSPLNRVRANLLPADRPQHGVSMATTWAPR